jgi:glycosyltransferase involved in cell wall biosynthesis
MQFADGTTAWPSASNPQISFILPVGGGSDRIPHFRLSVASLLAQVDCPCEIIVVEYSAQACYAAAVPMNCTYHHLPADPQVDGYNKSAAMNAGVRLARAEVVVLLDADMVVPQRLAAWLRERFERHPDLSAMRFARLIFNFDENDSRAMIPSGPLVVPQQIKFVNQNTPMPLAFRKCDYESIGGHDESFVGWGGEDVEFLSRLRTLKCSEGGRVPIVHVWHPFAPQKATGHGNLELLKQTLKLSPETRIVRLRESGCLTQSR